MAINSVSATLNGQTYNLTYNSSTGAYEATITAPSKSSYNQTNHIYAMTVIAADTADINDCCAYCAGAVAVFDCASVMAADAADPT